MTPTAARVLAQLAADGRPCHSQALAAALYPFDPQEAEKELQALAARGLAVVLRAPGFGRTGLRGPVFYEISPAGALEAAGGAQTSMIERPPVAVQPALF